MKLFLDDYRDPGNCISYMYRRIGVNNLLYNEGWYVVRNYDQFVAAINKHWEEITHISFDHDLADKHYGEEVDYSRQEKTGYHCALYVRDFYKGKRIAPPVMFVHSMNPVGTENIINVFKK